MRLLFYFLFMSVLLSKAQDTLYTANGNKIIAKVLEINPIEIKYKNPSNLEGPIYIISKSDVVLIQFSNGTNEIINANPVSYTSQSNQNSRINDSVIKTLPNFYYMNSNLISINALALANSDITIIYDREFFKSKLNLSFLAGYNFNSRMNPINWFIYDAKKNAKKNYDLGLGINFMPRNKKRVQYFVGALAKYMSYSYDEPINPRTNLYYKRADGYELAFMITNGWLFRISPNFNFKVFWSLGSSRHFPDLNSGYRLPKNYIGYCFGYRF